MDSKLGRNVAIKLLPETFTNDAERAARFEREARLNFGAFAVSLCRELSNSSALSPLLKAKTGRRLRLKFRSCSTGLVSSGNVFL
jgi:hypothetical protein